MVGKGVDKNLRFVLGVVGFGWSFIRCEKFVNFDRYILWIFFCNIYLVIKNGIIVGMYFGFDIDECVGRWD